MTHKTKSKSIRNSYSYISKALIKLLNVTFPKLRHKLTVQTFKELPLRRFLLALHQVMYIKQKYM